MRRAEVASAQNHHLLMLHSTTTQRMTSFLSKPAPLKRETPMIKPPRMALMKLRTTLKMASAIPMSLVLLRPFLPTLLNPFLRVMKPIFMSLPWERKSVSSPTSTFSLSSYCFLHSNPFSRGVAEMHAFSANALCW